MELGSLVFAIFFMIVIIIYEKYITVLKLAKIKQQQNNKENIKYNIPKNL